MGSLVGAIVAGVLVGIVESMAVLFVPEAAKVSMFVIMALVLLVRPQGLFGRAGLMN
jgi:branched-chain amino acid transport system permease protein